MTVPLPAWPDPPPAFGSVVLREFADRDVPMVVELATDPYVPLIGTLPAAAGEPDAREWISRQHRRRPEGGGLSFAIAWTIPGLHRIELYIEPWNAGSIRVAESAAYRREGLLRSHQKIGDRRRDMLPFAAVRVRARTHPPKPTPAEEPGRRPSEGRD